MTNVLLDERRQILTHVVDHESIKLVEGVIAPRGWRAEDACRDLTKRLDKVMLTAVLPIC